MAGVDTIVAIATAAGRAGIGVVRVSGPAVSAIVRGILGRALQPGKAYLRPFRDASGVAIDRGIALYFSAPVSYTGEDVLELQGHGGPVVLSLVLERCIELGARMAQPGEFTQRAFLNDKLDLAQAEAVADLIDASTQRAARSAMCSLAGEFSKQVVALQQRLTELRVLFEASFDFPEEELDVLSECGAREKLTALAHEIRAALDSAHQGSLLRDGVTIALVGPPNVGKSSLLNVLSKNEVAIVTPVPGTTRDLIPSTIALEGFPVQLLDTAGLRETHDAVETIGVEKARRAARDADLVLAISDETSAWSADPALATIPSRVIHVHNKIDLCLEAPRSERIEGNTHVWISAKFALGISHLTEAIVHAIEDRPLGEGVGTARQRHVAALRRAAEHIERAMPNTLSTEFAAEELRSAQEALSELTGEQVADDLLGEIFARFCIGK